MLQRIVRAVVLAVVVLLSGPSVARAQVAPGAVTPDQLTVFLDCRTVGCDRNFLITELPWVLWTQDRLDAEVHALITGLQTGAGGVEITIALLGQRRFVGRGDTLVTSIPPNSTDDSARREVTRLLKLALVPYALRTGVASRLELGLAEREEGAGPPRRISDPWNFWVYRLSGFGGANAESRESEFEFEGTLSASRVTERTKIEIDLDYEYQGASFTLSDSTKESFVLREYDFDQRFVRSITDHWSLGGSSSLGMTEFSNQNVYASVEVGPEYNLYPWREATRRQLVAILTVGGRYYDYEERTIYGLTAEIRPATSLIVAGETRQAWGSADASLEHSRFLHRTDSYSVRFDGSANFRITRGLSLRIGAFGEKVNDQLYLPRGDATDEEVLTRQRALATAYRYGANIGLSFTFGSIYNTIVNPRFDRVN